MQEQNDVNAWLRLPWTEQKFKAQDAVDYRNVAGIPFQGPATGEENDPRLIIIPGGWDHERCTLCCVLISENPGNENIAYTNGDDWLCRGCFKEQVQNGEIVEER